MENLTDAPQNKGFWCFHRNDYLVGEGEAYLNPFTGKLVISNILLEHLRIDNLGKVVHDPQTVYRWVGEQ